MGSQKQASRGRPALQHNVPKGMYLVWPAVEDLTLCVPEEAPPGRPLNARPTYVHCTQLREAPRRPINVLTSDTTNSTVVLNCACWQLASVSPRAMSTDLSSCVTTSAQGGQRSYTLHDDDTTRITR
jgi:hypothetical protein